MLNFWIIMGVLWMVLFIVNLASGETGDHQAEMAFMCIILANIEQVRRKIGD